MESSRLCCDAMRQSGFLADASDLQGFADKLRLVLEDRELARRLGGAARVRAVEHFERHHVVQQYEALYRELLERS